MVSIVKTKKKKTIKNKIANNIVYLFLLILKK
jgi:hypothetical protein